MKLRVQFILISFLISISGCAVAGGIFKAGIWTGLLIVATIITVLILFIKNISKKI
jgi:hypothetical protein